MSLIHHVPSVHVRLLLVLLVALVFPASVRADSQMASANEPPVPLLWKVSGERGALYILGSFHLLRPDDYPLSPDVEAAFADSQQVVFELPPQEMASPALALQMGQAAIRTDGTTLDSQLSPELRAKLAGWVARNQELLQRNGIDAQSLRMFKPWFVSLNVSLSEMTKLGLDPKLGLDMHFAQAAQRVGKPTSGMETGAQQIAFLNGMDETEQLQMLEESLDEAEQGAQAVEALHRLWREGDAAGLWQRIGAQMQARHPRLYRHLNVERNGSWMPRLARRLQESDDNTLLIVGALHTLGDDGIVEKLRAMGFQVRRICTACALGTLDVDRERAPFPPPRPAAPPALAPPVAG